MCSENGNYNFNSIFSPKRAKDEFLGILKLIIFVVFIVCILMVIGYVQEQYNNIVNLIINLF